MQLYRHAYATATARENMARDWALLIGAAAAEAKYGPTGLPEGWEPSTDTAHFRAYDWTEDAMSIGYTQKQAAIAAHLRPGATIVRRPTAGGVVDHANDWTYALSLPREAPLARERSSNVYVAIHGALLDALDQCGVPATLHPCPCDDAPAPSADQTTGTAACCFLSPVPHDLMTPNGAKLAGAALRRTRQGLLIQGSIQRSHLGTDFPYASFEATLAQAFAALLNAKLFREGEQPVPHDAGRPRSVTTSHRRGSVSLPAQCTSPRGRDAPAP